MLSTLWEIELLHNLKLLPLQQGSWLDSLLKYDDQVPEQ